MVTTFLDKFDIVPVCNGCRIKFVRFKIYLVFREFIVITKQPFMIEANLEYPSRDLDHFFNIWVLSKYDFSISARASTSPFVPFRNLRRRIIITGIAKAMKIMLKIINHKLLMLHFMLISQNNIIL